MKKTLIACGVASALAAGSAFAADVQLYGLINAGLSYVHTDSDEGTKTNKFSMENGQEFGSRWGIKGSEDLGNNVKLSFVLESGFESDTGSLDVKQGTTRIFGREASVTLSTDYGRFSFGRLCIFGSVLSQNGLFRAIDPLFSNYTSFGSGKATASMWTRVDNAISYVTPTFAGFTGYAMYSFKNDSTASGDENKSSADRYASLALRYQGHGLEAVLVADTTNWGTKGAKASGTWTKGKDGNNGYTVTLGGNYTLDNGIKPIIWGQYFKDQYLNSAANAGDLSGGLAYVTEEKKSINNYYGFVTGWGAGVGLHVPAFGGTAKFAANYRDMDNEKDIDFTRWSVYAGYDYNLSKRTAVYAMTGYNAEKAKSSSNSATPSAYEFCFGILHRF